MVIVTETVLAAVSAMVTVPTVPEIPRLFPVRLKETELADAKGAKAKAVTTTTANAESFILEIRTADSPSKDKLLPKVTHYLWHERCHTFAEK
jgi:hypothetical protein